MIDERGWVLSNDRFPSTHESLDVFLAGIKDAKFVLVSTCIWEYIYEGIEDRGFEIVHARPLKVRAIAEARVTTDKVDAETLNFGLTRAIPDCDVNVTTFCMTSFPVHGSSARLGQSTFIIGR